MKHLLLTAFEPFLGRAQNSSHEFGVSVKKELETRGVVVNFLRLPVVYDKAAEVAINYFKTLNIKPGLVISLGEGKDRICLEALSYNYDNEPNAADNEGNIRENWVNCKDYEKEIFFNLPIKAMRASLDKKFHNDIIISRSIGGYVCNNTAFRLAHYFRNLNILYGFIHVPRFESDSLLDKTKIEKILFELIYSAIHLV